MLLLLAVALVPGWLYVRVSRGADAQPTHRADVIIVLGSGGTASEPSPIYRGRLRYALDLYRRGYAPAIIVTERSPVAEGAKRWLTQRGVRREDIALENRSRTTWENLTHSRGIMRRRGWRSAIVTSCPFHLYRALLMARELGIPAQGAGSPYSPFDPHRRSRSHLMWLEVRKLLLHAIWEPPGHLVAELNARSGR